MSTRFFALDARNAEFRELLDSAPEIAEPYHRLYEMSWLHHESALDGLVLTETELVQALDHHVVGDASLMSVINGIRNHRQALLRVDEEARSPRRRVSLSFLTELYEILIRGEVLRKPGILRAEMPLHRTYTHEIAQPDAIGAGLEKLIQTLVSVEFKEFHPIKQASQAHWLFMQVFPFANHNGKLGRLLQTLYLRRAGFPPAIIHAVDRQRYHEALRLPSSALRNLLLDALGNSLENSFRHVEELRAGGEPAKRSPLARSVS